MEHPIHLNVQDDLQRTRLTVFFRIFLVIPHIIVLALWGIAVYVLAVVNWFVALFKAELPAGLHEFQAKWLRYNCQVSAYYNLIADPWPQFGGGDYPVDLMVAPPEHQSRLTVFFRSLLAIPAAILAYVLGAVMGVVTFIAWFACLFTGRMPEGMRNLNAFVLRYQMQFFAYILLLTPRYPSLNTEETGSAVPAS